jgi:hypothetical protein
MALDADQRAMLRLLAQREQGYEDIGALMGLSVDQVRARVRDALAELDRLDSAAASGDRIEPPAPPAQEPASPQRAAPAAAPRSTPSRPKSRSRPLGSRLPRVSLPGDRRRALELLGGVVLVILVILFATGAVDIGGGSGSGGGTSGSAEGEAINPSNPKLTQAILKPVGGGDASGRALFGRIGKKVALQVEAKGLEQPPSGQSYVIWLARSPKVMVPLTPVEVSKSGEIAVQYPLPPQVIGYLAGRAFDEIDISLVSGAIYKVSLNRARKSGKPPTYTGTDVLRGGITGPIVGAALRSSKR